MPARRVTRRRAVATKVPVKGSATYSRLGGTIGETLGGFVAPGIGSRIGGALGTMGGSMIDYVTGKGDYMIHKNTLIKPGNVPSFGKGCVRITHREFVAKIDTTSAFAIQSFPINPGMPLTFPWLSQIANNFEMYKMNGLIFEYKSYSADALNSTNTALGKIVLATDYNALDDPYANIQQMYATEFANSGPPSANIMHAVECEPAENPLKLYFIRAGALPETEHADIRMFDMGNFQVATEGAQAASQAGELWVTYDVSLCKPSLQSVDQGETLKWAHATLTSVSNVGASGVFKFGDNLTMAEGSKFVITGVDSSRISLPASIDSGKYLVLLSVSGTGTAITLPNPILVNCVAQTTWWQQHTTNVMYAPNNGTSSPNVVFGFVMKVTGAGVEIDYDNGSPVWPTNITAVDLVIAQMPDDLA